MLCKYVIELIYTNGNKEVIDDNYNYKDAMTKYRKIRDGNSNFTRMSFIQVENDKRKVMFTKKNDMKSENKTVFQLLSQMNDIINELDNKHNSLNDQISLMDKRKNVFEHKHIEFLNAGELTNEDKVRLFDEYRKLLIQRRELKNEFKSIQSAKPELGNIISNNKRLNDKMNKYIDKTKKCTESMINDSTPENFDKQVIDEYSYKDHKERIKLTKELLTKYDRVIHDEMIKKLVCYNKSKSAM